MASSLINLILLLISFLSCTMWSSTCYAATSRNTLKIGDTLDSSSSLVSATGKFTLSFKVHDRDSNSSYLTVRSEETTHDVWIANRDRPISYPSSAVLTLDSKKTLKISHQGGDPIQLYSASETTSTSVVATLLDSGNFIVHEDNSSDESTNRILWQSFDYPTDTLLLGMKLGVDHRDGHTWSLTSWATEYNSTEPGPFTLDWDPNGRELKLKRRGVVYWTSGAYRSMKFLFFLPDEIRMRYNFSIVSTESEDYITYISYTSADQNQRDMPMSWVLTTMGQLYETNGGIDIARGDYCNGSNTDGGCQQRQNICTDNRRYEDKHGSFNPTNSNATISIDPDTSLNYSDCQTACRKDCECLGSQALFDNHTGCRYWIGLEDWKFIPDQYSGRRTSVLNLAAGAAATDKKMGIKIGIGTAIGITIALWAIVSCIVYYRRKHAHSGENEAMIEHELHDLTGSDTFTNANGLQNNGKMGHDLRAFSYASIMVTTNNFSKENKLGEGGFGPVYKGTLTTGQEIAVKRLSRSSGQGALEFKNELVLISELQHTNLVKLLGFCVHGEERMLLYEYMPNKSLDYFLFDSTRGMLLDWKMRFSIIEGIAQGLLYLHKYSRLRVIHRDLKASNILLDQNMNPKISDFGMARIFAHNELEANTNRVVGTYGYMSPEYAMEGIFSIKSDVYSFGVLMLEIISGRKNNSFYNDDRALNLVGYSWELWKEGTWLELMDPTLGDSCIRDRLLRCIHVGLLCVEEDAADRPTMQDVISMLTNESVPLALPTRPAFSFGRKVIRPGMDGEQLEIISVNGLSISGFDAR